MIDALLRKDAEQESSRNEKERKQLPEVRRLEESNEDEEWDFQERQAKAEDSKWLVIECLLTQ